MAIYHIDIKPISRGNGRSATAASAYRAAERVADARTGEVFDYTRKRGVEHTEIVLPENATPGHAWARSRERLWNAAEQAERRSDSRVAREYEVALPHELSARQRLDLARDFARELADRYGCAVDVAVHAPHREGDVRNFHAHLLATTRRLEPEGLGAKTTIELKDADRAKLGLPPAKQEIRLVRERWAALTNDALARHDIEARVDHRSLEDQGIDREPQRHQGPAVTAMLRRGQKNEVGWRVAAEVDDRLARAAEAAQIAREVRSLDQQILVASTDLKQALALRESLESRGPDAATLREQGRAQWLAARFEKDGAVLLDAGLTKTREHKPESDHGLILD